MGHALEQDGVEEERQLVELKAVDGAYPFFGAVSLSPTQDLQKALRCDADVCGAVAEQTLLDRLGLAPGGLMKIGTQVFRLTAVLDSEPDRIAGGFSLGPHVLISNAALARTGLVTLGSLIDYTTTSCCRRRATVEGFKHDATTAFADAGWDIRDRSDAAPGIRRFVEQVTMFLTLVGLTALAVGGVGAGQAVSAFLDRKRAEIAIFKSLGADGGLIFLVFFFQVMAIAVAAVITASDLGAALPFAIEYAYGADIPAPAHFALYAGPLLLAAAFGLLSAIACAVPPLARARLIPPASLFRDLVAPVSARGAWPYLAGAATAGALVVGLALLLAPSPLFAAECLGGTAIGLVALRLIAEGLRMALRRLPRPRSPTLRLALANLTRPGAATAGVVTALGLGLDFLRENRLAARQHHRGAGQGPPPRHRAELLLRRHPTGRGGALRRRHPPLQIRARLPPHPDDPWTDQITEGACRQGSAPVAPEANGYQLATGGITHAATPPAGRSSLPRASGGR